MAAWDHAVFPCGTRLLWPRTGVIFPVRSFIPNGRCSQCGVKVPTGGKGRKAQARERLPKGFLPKGRVSRFGATPKPTVKVRMKENGRSQTHRKMRLFVVPCALILVLKRKAMNQMLQDSQTETSQPAQTPPPVPATGYPRFAKPQRVAFVQACWH